MKAITLWSSQADNAQSGSAGVVVTQSDLNPVLQIVTWLLLAITTLMLGFRLLASFFLKAKRVPGQEDVFILISYVCWITGVFPRSRPRCFLLLSKRSIDTCIAIDLQPRRVRHHALACKQDIW